jgi:hypothetical protein
MSYSQIGQDNIVSSLCERKNGGFFVDIGCGFPTYISNTFLLENEYNWSGICLDIEDQQDPGGLTWSELRPKSHHLIADALTIDYEKVFAECNCPRTVDYLSIDLEPPDLTLECLFRIPFEKYTFNVITFETDEYREGGERRRAESRTFLAKHGYRLLQTLNRQDDVYVHELFRCSR